MVRGGGRIDLGAASTFSATVSAIPATGSVGAGQPSFSFGEFVSSAIVRSASITLSDVSGTTMMYSVSIVPAVAGPSVTSSVTSLTVAAGGTGTFTVTLQISPAVASGQYYGDIQLTGGPVTLNIPYWVQVDPQIVGNGHSRSL